MFRQLRHLLLLATVGVALSSTALSPPAAFATSPLPTTAAVSRIEPVVALADVEIPLGRTVPIDNGAIDVTFTEVVEDSRCPTNVMCVWRGRAVVGLRIRHLDGSETDELLTKGREPSALTLPADGYGLLLVSLTPYPMAGASTPPADSTGLTVRVTKCPRPWVETHGYPCAVATRLPDDPAPSRVATLQP